MGWVLFSHFTEEKTEAQKSQTTRLRSWAAKKKSLDSNLQRLRSLSHFLKLMGLDLWVSFSRCRLIFQSRSWAPRLSTEGNQAWPRVLQTPVSGSLGLLLSVLACFLPPLFQCQDSPHFELGRLLFFLWLCLESHLPPNFQLQWSRFSWRLSSPPSSSDHSPDYPSTGHLCWGLLQSPQM